MPWACHSGILEPYIIKCGPHFPTSLIHTDDLYKFLVNLNLWSACKHQKHYWENVLHLCYHRRRHCVTIAGRSATNSTWVCSECNVHWIVLDFFGQHPAEVGLRMALISRLHPENVSEKIQIAQGLCNTIPMKKKYKIMFHGLWLDKCTEKNGKLGNNDKKL